MYLPDTAVLVTRFFTEDGLGQVVDFMPPAGSTATDSHRIVRIVQCVRGRMTFDIDVAPRFDYGRHPHTAGDDRARRGVQRERPAAHAARRPRARTTSGWPRSASGDGDVHATLPLVAGQTRGRGAGVGRRRPAAGDPCRRRSQALFDETVAFWRSWLAKSTYTGRWREDVQRSAITLKLMTYAPTGGIVAAPTAAPARAGRRRAQLGLPLHLGARRLLLGARAAEAGHDRRGGAVRLVAG